MVAAACASSQYSWVPYAPASGSTSSTNAQVVQKAAVAITDAGEGVETSDADAGLVLSKWITRDGMGSGENRFRVRVTVTDGAYEVVAQCQRLTAMTRQWEDGGCGDKRPRYVVDLVERIDAALK